ncbi:hypothetical protein CTZ27_27520 [Streptomyces griseocarneus]|nr:hypothetical protein CTZ27_27520 [Streptomyces griseocarneus]
MSARPRTTGELLAPVTVIAPRSGGVAGLLGAGGEPDAVLPLPDLDRLLTGIAEQARRIPGPQAARTTSCPEYHEPEGRGSHGIAEDLLFLAQTRR